MNIGPAELILVLVILLLIFGVGRIGRLGGELGTAIRAFRQGLSDDEPDSDAPTAEEERINERRDDLRRP